MVLAKHLILTDLDHDWYKVGGTTAPNNINDNIFTQGNVGIGIINPLAKLHVVGGDAYFTDQPLNNFSTSRSVQAIVTDNLRPASDNGIRLYDGNSNSHLHIGSLTYTYLQAYNTSSISSGILGTGTLDFDDNTNFAHINLNPLGGNIGMGTLAPTEKLQVNGNIRVGLINPPNTGTYPNYGNKIYFSGGPVGGNGNSDATDPLWISRYNELYDRSQLRINIGDNSSGDDALHIGKFLSGQSTFTTDFILSNNGQAYKAGGGSWAATSDRRTKKDITAFSDGLNVLTKINPVTFKYNGLYKTNDDGKDYVGIIAQEVKKIAPYMIGSYEATKIADSKEMEEILNYDGGTYMLYVLVNSVKEQQLQIDKLKKSNEILLEEIKALKK